jgi:autotransporter adhesin
MSGRKEAVSGIAVSSTQGAASVGSAGNERQITHVAGGTHDTDAVNLRQLQAVSAGGVRYDTHADGSIDNSRVTLGNGQAPGGVTLSNVAPGVAGTDAVNVNQLASGLAGANAYTDARVNGLQNEIDGVAKKAYSGVAAAMAMESARYVPGKVTYAAGLGQYRSQSAVGVSFRRTADNGRWSVTGGVSAASGGAAIRVGISGVFD